MKAAQTAALGEVIRSANPAPCASGASTGRGSQRCNVAVLERRPARVSGACDTGNRPRRVSLCFSAAADGEAFGSRDLYPQCWLPAVALAWNAARTSALARDVKTLL